MIGSVDLCCCLSSIFMCRLHFMMMVIFCSPLWLSVNSTCIQKEISWRRLRIYPWQQIENFSQKNLGQETCCLKAYITKLWMEHWRTLASLWQGSGKGHLAVSPFYILIARKVSNQLIMFVNVCSYKMFIEKSLSDNMLYVQLKRSSWILQNQELRQDNDGLKLISS